jgi:hypothetical protein
MILISAAGMKILVKNLARTFHMGKSAGYLLIFENSIQR